MLFRSRWLAGVEIVRTPGGIANRTFFGRIRWLIPPSIPMVLYCIAGEVSIGEMFMAGFIPGFLMTAALALTTYAVSYTHLDVYKRQR